MITPNLNETQFDKTLEDKISPRKDLERPVRQAIAPYRRYDGRLIRLIYDVYRQDEASEIYCLRFNEDLLGNYK